MCKSKSEGGGRCEYADALANVRHKTRSKFKNLSPYKADEKVEAALEIWHKENPELTKAHLPVSQPFQVPAKPKPIPSDLLAMFTSSRTEPVTGFTVENREAHTKKLHEEYQTLQEVLTKDESTSLLRYAMNAYEPVNKCLRRKGFTQLLKNSAWKVETVKKVIQNMDSAMTKATMTENPRKLFRFFKVPTGITPGEYIDRYLKTGEGFKEKGFMSTTADPEFIMAALYKANKGTKNSKYIVMEILSKRGASLQSEPVGRSGDIQSLEKEVLLPRNSQFRIAGVRKSQRFEFASDRRDLNNNYFNHYSDSSYKSYGHFKKGERMNFPLVQMVDEDLIK